MTRIGHIDMGRASLRSRLFLLLLRQVPIVLPDTSALIMRIGHYRPADTLYVFVNHIDLGIVQNAEESGW
ncbi:MULTISPECIES: hypothetical protein [Agrobacterium]|uniref:Uncharacterized protein n=1 Tax=Agrobacterium tumefaciens TaxID=358 RepID=A0AAE6BB55_AGRTU|nr:MULTISPECIES: hypothetical protein [Agrobacterium]QCL72845.1 hypothetical protein CFBP5499_05020 [Agrobacterium tumefaciens]QCL78421.1 hypothetical protein CFBP5877_04580 [Agrobacterium tumefaciens]